MNRTTFTVISLVALLAAASAGCEGLQARSKHLTGADAFEWEGESRFRIRGEKAMWGQADVFDQELSVFVKGFPPGTILSVGDIKATVNESGDASLKAGISSQLGSVPLAALPEATISDLMVTVQAPDGQPIQVTLPPKRLSGLDGILLKVAEGPLLFGAEQPGQAGPIRNVMWVDWTRDHPVLGPKPTTLKDLDAIAIVKRLDGPTKVCTGYTGEDGQPAPDLNLRLSDVDASIYARRTGAVVATRRFPAVDKCPEFATGEKDRQIARDSQLPEEELRAWLTGQLAP